MILYIQQKKGIKIMDNLEFDNETLGYFIYMSECERQDKENLESAAVGKDKVDSNEFLV